MKQLIWSALLFCLSTTASAANLGLSPSSLKLKVYKFSVSSSPLCTNPETVIDNGTAPVEVDFVNLPNLGSGSISDGTYPCVIVEFSDHIKFTPSTNSTGGNCQSSREETMDVCRSGSSRLSDGSTTACTTSANRVAMHLSTASTSTNGTDAFNRPTSLGDAAHGFQLQDALEVSGGGAGKFVVNPSGKVCDGNDGGCDGGGNAGECRMEPPTFTFASQY